MSDSLPTTNPSDDVFWTAVRYVWDELSAEDRLAFEERLATDVSACAAVAEAVRLCAGLQSPAVSPILARPAADRHPISRGRLLAAASCCAAAVVVGFALLSGDGSRQTNSVELASAELVGRWTAGVPGGPFDESFEDDLDGESEIINDSLSAPDWLLAAVKLTAGDGGQDGNPGFQKDQL